MAVKVRNVAGKWFGEGGGGEMPGGTGLGTARIFAALCGGLRAMLCRGRAGPAARLAE